MNGGTEIDIKRNRILLCRIFSVIHHGKKLIVVIAAALIHRGAIPQQVILPVQPAQKNRFLPCMDVTPRFPVNPLSALPDFKLFSIPFLRIHNTQLLRDSVSVQVRLRQIIHS